MRDGLTALVQRFHWVGDGLNLLALYNDAVATSETQGFTYDDAGRMLTASGPYGSRTWTYDKVGNRVSEVKTKPGAVQIEPTTAALSRRASAERPTSAVKRSDFSRNAAIRNAPLSDVIGV